MLFSRKDLIRLIVPLMGEHFLNISIGLVATVMVASAGEAAVSGVSMVDAINQLMSQLFMAMATGGAVVASQYLGRKDEGNARVAAHQLITTACGIALIMGILMMIFRNAVLSLVLGDVDIEVMRNAETYLYFSAVSYPFLALFSACSAIFRSQGISRVPMFGSLWLNIVHLILNLILINGMDTGVFGVGISMVVARIVSGLLLFVQLQRHNLKVGLTYKAENWKPQPTMMWRILCIGIPNGVENALAQIGRILLQSLVATLGVTAMAANGVANSLAHIQVIPGQAAGMAMLTVVGHCVGAGDFEQAKYYIKRLMAFAYAGIIVINVLLLVPINHILLLYDLAPETNAVIRDLLLINAFICCTIWSLSAVLPNALRAAGDVKYPMFISGLSMWVFRIGTCYPLIYLFDLGIYGIWIPLFFDCLCRAVGYVTRIRGTKWQQKNVIGERSKA